MSIVKTEISFCSEVHAVKKIVTDILCFCAENLPSLSPEDRGDLRLMFSELLFNAVIHGNASDAGKSVFISVEIDGASLTAAITDEGPGFDYDKLISSFGHDNITESGRGIQLVYSLADTVTFNSHGNKIVFTKKVIN